MLDQIGTSHMTQGSLTSFIEDRFGNVNSALALNEGWTQVPSGSYFNTSAYSITVWVYPATSGTWARLIDFGNGDKIDNILISIDSGSNQKPCFQLFNSTARHGTGA